jgi:hypothetical protein
MVYTDGLVTVSILTEEEAENYRNMTPGVSITNDMIRCVAENDEEKQIIETTATGMNRIRVKRTMKEKPDLEYFCGKLYKGFCGHCGRILFTGGRSVEELRKLVTVCNWCGCEVDWSE